MEENQKSKGKQKVNWNIKPYLAIGLTAFIVITLSIAFFFLIFRYHGFTSYWNKLMGILQPIILGLVFAYLINPIVNFEEKKLLPVMKKHIKNEVKAKRLTRGISVACALIFVIFILAVLIMMVIPELYVSLERMVRVLPRQVESFIAWAQHYSISDSQVAKFLEQGLNSAVDYFNNLVKVELLPQTKNVLTLLTSGVISMVKVLFNIIIGIMVSIYVLMGKETFVGQAKKIVYAILPARKGNVVIRTVRKSNEILGGFISGKILDSAIIGVICFVCLYLLKMPYTVLVSVIVGVTNVIPFFGPYIGAIPSAILIILANPLQGLYFIIFILVLQQVDGNIIGPKILGESTGLTSFWVIFAILVGGGLFGFVGMVMGVPIFGIFYYIAKELVEHILRKKKLPKETKEYIDVSQLKVDTNRLVYMDEEKKKKPEDKEGPKKEK